MASMLDRAIDWSLAFAREIIEERGEKVSPIIHAFTPEGRPDLVIPAEAASGGPEIYDKLRRIFREKEVMAYVIIMERPLLSEPDRGKAQGDPVLSDGLAMLYGSPTMRRTYRWPIDRDGEGGRRVGERLEAVVQPQSTGPLLDLLPLAPLSS